MEKSKVKSSKNNNDKFSYDEAKAELEQILDELEQGEAGVDQLAKLVKRASELIRLCKEKLRSTDAEVKGILDQMGNDE
jgi:exodeoxyribonuclease VII small subunit